MSQEVLDTVLHVSIQFVHLAWRSRYRKEIQIFLFLLEIEFVRIHIP